MPTRETGISLPDVITTIRAREQELRKAGVISLAVFGSAARGHADPDSDIDVLVRLNQELLSSGFAYFGRIDALAQRLGSILGTPVDVVTEPVQKPALRENIERGQTIAF